MARIEDGAMRTGHLAVAQLGQQPSPCLEEQLVPFGQAGRLQQQDRSRKCLAAVATQGLDLKHQARVAEHGAEASAIEAQVLDVELAHQPAQRSPGGVPPSTASG